MNKQESGKLGEDAALAYLMKKGYRLLARNYRARRCEIDLVMENEPYLVFVEVKARATRGAGAGSDALTAAKRRRLLLTAQDYIARHPEDCVFRFDLVEITRDGLWHIVNAFEA